MVNRFSEEKKVSKKRRYTKYRDRFSLALAAYSIPVSSLSLSEEVTNCNNNFTLLYFKSFRKESFYRLKVIISTCPLLQ